MNNIKKFQGIGQFGPAYRVMFENDSHAPGSVDRVLMDNMIGLISDTAAYLYSEYTPVTNFYEKGSRPQLENIIERMNHDGCSGEELVRRIANFTAKLQDKRNGASESFEIGGTEEYIIEHGSDWCTDVARVGCALFQAAGFPARLVYLANTGKAYSGHVVAEVFREGAWGVVDTSTDVVYRCKTGKPVSLWGLMNAPDVIEMHSNGDMTPYTNADQFGAAAISNYFIRDRKKYDYARSGINEYYRSILDMSEKGWLGGLRWIHGESDEKSQQEINVTAILFDLDNTLYDQREAQKHIILTIARQYPDMFGKIDEMAILDAFRRADTLAIAEFNTGISLDAVRTNRSKHLLNTLGVDESLTEEITRKFIEGYSTAVFPIPDSKRVVKSLHAKYKTGIVTNGSPDTQSYKLASLDLENHIDCIIFSEALGIRKPDPKIFLTAAQALDVAPAHCLFVGDSYEDDIIGSKKAGMHACWFNRGRAQTPPEKFHEIEITMLSELLDAL